jgi:hypothetical protein
MANNFKVKNGLQIGSQVIIGATTGTAPIVTTSTTKVSNLNADRVDDLEGTQLARLDAANSYQVSPQVDPANWAYQYVNNYYTTKGIPHFIGNWMSTGLWGIGSNSSAADNCVKIGRVDSSDKNWNASASNVKLKASVFISDVAVGTAPLTVTSTTKVDNLNVDLLDGYNTATAATASTIPVRDTNGDLPGNVLGSAAKLTTARSISLTGAVTGTVNFDGSANVSMTTTAASVANEGVFVTAFGATGNGTTDDSTAIQNAIDSLDSTVGGIVYFPSGTYRINVALTVGNNVSIIGIGKATIKRGAAINNLMRNKANGVTGGWTAHTGVIVENMTFDGNAASYGGTQCTLLTFGHSSYGRIKQCTFKGVWDWHLLELNACFDYIVEGCTFKEYGTTSNTGIASEMLQLDGMIGSAQFPWFGPYDDTFCKNIKILNNTFLGTTDYWFYSAIGNHSFVAGGLTKDIVIQGNYFEYVEECVNLSDVAGMTVIGNTMRDVEMGVVLASQASSNWTVRITGNNYYGNYHATAGTHTEGRFVSINLSGANSDTYDVIISNNTIRRAHFHAIAGTWTGGVIEGNTIDTCGRCGIFLFGGTKYTVTGNKIINTGLHEVDERDASVMIGGNTSITTSTSIVSGNNLQTLEIGSDVTANQVLVVSNTITVSVTNSAGCTYKNNLVNGSWVA